MEKKGFGCFNGKQVHEYTIKNGNVCAKIIDFGARIRAVELLRKDGSILDVVLGYNTVEEYANYNGYLGATVGRVANRIANAKFTLNGKEYNLTKNNGENCLHGGTIGFDKKIWELGEFTENSVTLKTFSPDGENGFPANMNVSVTFTITDNQSLKIEYRAVADADTLASFTNHAYFNLNGESGQNIFDTELCINADKITPVNEKLIPDGRYLDVKGTIYDFTKGKKIGNYFESDDEYLKKFHCYDVNYALNGSGYRKIAVAKSDVSGIEMQVYSDACGVQLYTETFLEGRKGKTVEHGKGSAFCLETQFYPNAINCTEYPSCVLEKGKQFYSATEYQFKGL